MKATRPPRDTVADSPQPLPGNPGLRATDSASALASVVWYAIGSTRRTLRLLAILTVFYGGAWLALSR